MKNKILSMLLAIALIANIGGTIYHNNVIEHKNATISQLQINVQTKSTKIAKLGDVIKLQDENLIKKQKVIDTNLQSINELENKAKQLQVENNRLKAENFKKRMKGSDVGTSSNNKPKTAKYRTLRVTATAYTPYCNEGCTGVTATGVNVSNSIYYNGDRIIAVDTSVIPLYSLVNVETENGSFTALAIDTGGAIHGSKIDVLVRSTSEAYDFGRQRVKLTVLREGK